nr:EOG090X0ED2 [Ilyocryptus agilis]
MSENSYYGDTILQHLNRNGDSSAIQLSKAGPIYSMEWSPIADEFCVVYGFMPSKATVFNSKCDVLWELSSGAKNVAYYSFDGLHLALCGFGNVAGNIEVWNMKERKRISQIEALDTTHFQWCYDNHHFVTATTAPRLRVKNGVKRVTIELGDLTQHNLKQLKVLNRDVFPVAYNEKFYKDLLGAGELCKLAYCNDIVVGAVCCRIDQSENRRRLYIMTLGVLAKYRELGLGTLMLEHVFKVCEHEGNIDSIYLHVQVNNDTALSFYKKFGFQIVSTAVEYYRRLEPCDAYLLERSLKKTVSNEQATSSSPSAAQQTSKKVPIVPLSAITDVD